MKNLLILGCLFITEKSFAQNDTSQPGLILTGYIETYYSFDFNKPLNHTLPSFIYSYNRHNEVNLNLGLIKVSYQNKMLRANLALATGTYQNASLASEQGILKNIFEANTGVKISKKKNLWVDAGIFASHIGFESAIGIDCWNLTRSMPADNSPYLESGAKVSYTSDNVKWFISGLLLNGWQRIERVNGNNTVAFGHQLTYKPNSKITINSSSFIGNDKPDSIKQMRYFHDFYAIMQLTAKWGITGGFDICMQQRPKGRSSFDTWYSPVIIFKLNVDAHSTFAARIEYYSDPNGVIITTFSPYGFRTWGYSINYDYIITKNALWRIEARGFSGNDKTFIKNNSPSKTDFFLTTAVEISF